MKKCIDCGKRISKSKYRRCRTCSNKSRRKPRPVYPEGVCFYCGQEGKYKLIGRGKVEKWCCSKSQNSCPGMKKKNSNALKGRNITWGSKISDTLKGRTLSEETKNKIGKSLSGRKRPRHSRRMKGFRNPMWGKKRSDLVEYNKKYKSEQIKGFKNPMWILDRNQRFAPYTEKHFDKDIRQKIFEEQDGKCGHCGGKDYPLHFHHIDYDKQNDERRNKIFLCISCHMKTNYNRDHWQKIYESKLLKKQEKSSII